MAKMTKGLGFLWASVLQVVIGFGLTALLAWLIGKFGQGVGFGDWVTLIVGFLTEIPVVGSVVDAITLFVTNTVDTQSSLNFVNSLMNLTSWDMLVAAGVGMWSGICFKFSKLIGLKGIPVIQSLCAVVICSLLNRYMNVYGDQTYTIMLFVFSVVLNLVLTILTADKKFFAVMWGIGSEVVVGVFACAFAAMLILLMQGLIASVAVALGVCFCLIIPIILFLLVDTCFF